MSGKRSISKNDWTGKQRIARHGYKGMNEENGLSNKSSHGEDLS
jgi:hypothetical protein